MKANAATTPDDRDLGRMPRHIAIIMDGNGRWATSRGLSRSKGHHAGLEALRRITRATGDLGVPYLTVYSFSLENWSRPRSEVLSLMGLLRRFIRKDLAELHQNNVRIRIIGRKDDLATDILNLLTEAVELTRENTGQTLTVAFNYGGRDEIVRAARKIAVDVSEGRLDPDRVCEATIAERLDTAGVPDPDLLIRTGGEERISNFLLWQCAYAEFVFSPVYWPDFGAEELDAAIYEFRSRERRFGGLVSKTGS
jgi:undecaprenyl diphosphate synthase